MCVCVCVCVCVRSFNEFSECVRTKQQKALFIVSSFSKKSTMMVLFMKKEFF